MTIKFIDCYIVSTDVKKDAYRKKDPNSTQGLEQDRVKIKTTQVRDCRRVNVQEEQDQEEQDQEEQDQEEQDQEEQDQEEQGQEE
jgi:hypothetical protein